MYKKIDRTGEERFNKFGSKIVIKEYRGSLDIDVYFPEYDWVAKHINYNNFKKGEVKCPYEPRVYGVGYLGEGKYTATENGKLTDEYRIYFDMLRRCYDTKLHEKHSTYKDCEVEEYLLNFQHMGKWINENYYEIPGEIICLDKDILCKGNKVYSRKTCIFVPQRINTLFTKSNKRRGKNPIGITLNSSDNYQVRCNNGYGKIIYLGSYTTKEEAFRIYKSYKEKIIKKVIDEYKGKIPEPHYSRLKEAIYNYKVEIDD